MLPYADQNEDYWSGYFTSRSDAKKQGRLTSSNLHASTKLSALKILQADVSDETVDKVLASKYTMMDALGIFQHHDAITGTAKEAVAERYLEILSSAVSQNDELYAELVSEQTANALPGLDWQACSLTSTTPVDCGIELGSSSIIVAAHNPSTVAREMLRFSVPFEGTSFATSVLAEDSEWKSVPSDLICFEATRDTPEADSYQACELFIQTQVAPSDFTLVKVESVTGKEGAASVTKADQEDPSTIQNAATSVKYLD